MAMVQCRECGGRVSDAAPTCPTCGVAAPAGNCSLVFTRSGLMGALVSVSIFVDGQPYGSLRPKGRIEVPVSPGMHHVEVQSSTGKSIVTSVSASGEVPLDVTFSKLTGAPKLK